MQNLLNFLKNTSKSSQFNHDDDTMFCYFSLDHYYQLISDTSSIHQKLNVAYESNQLVILINMVNLWSNRHQYVSLRNFALVCTSRETSLWRCTWQTPCSWSQALEYISRYTFCVCNFKGEKLFDVSGFVTHYFRVCFITWFIDIDIHCILAKKKSSI